MSNYDRSNVSKEELEKTIKKLQWIVGRMENRNIEFIRAEANTYLISEYISIAGKGFINLSDLGSYIDEEYEDDEY